MEAGRVWRWQARNMDIKGDSGKISHGNEECVIRSQRKDDPCYNMVGHRLYGIQKFSGNETGCLAGESKQSTEGVAWFLT